MGFLPSTNKPIKMAEEEEIKSLPFASDQAAMNFAYFYTALTIGHVLDRHILTRRIHIKAFRYSAWGIPLGIAAYWCAAPALPQKFKDWYWSFGTRGRFFPPYHDDDE